jgi:hypothetical protein
LHSQGQGLLWVSRIDDFVLVREIDSQKAPHGLLVIDD